MKLKIALGSKITSTFSSIIFTLFSVLLFDSLIASSSIMPFRLIYCISFSFITFVLAYISFLLMNDRRLSEKSFSIIFPRFFFITPIIFNIVVIFSVGWSGPLSVGFLDKMILAQGLNGLFPLMIFLIILGVNTVILCISTFKSEGIHLYEIPTYLLSTIAIETSLTIYAFHISGIKGIRYFLFFFHVVLIGLAIWLFYKNKRFYIKLTLSSLFLILVSVSIFMMVYIPFGIYNLYGDNAVIIGSTLSIIRRKGLQPYYIADNYYSPIMGFVVILFAYITGISNILLSSNLPFLIASLALPFVTYHFIKSFVTNDSRIAIIGTIVAFLMDGLAVILLPVYARNLTSSIINLYISPVTKSLYASNISQLWLTPYKSFANVSSIAACSILHKRRAGNFILGGALFFISFSNPRYSLLTVLLLLLLFGMKKISVKEIILFALSTISFCGFILPVTFYKQMLALFTELYKKSIINKEIFDNFYITLKLLISRNISSFVILIIFVSILGIFVLTYLNRSEKPDNTLFSLAKFRCGRLFLLGMVIIMFMYITIHAYLFDVFSCLTKNYLVASLNTIILRYHILVVFCITSLFILKSTSRIKVTYILIMLLFYLGGTLARALSLLPLIFTILALPTFSLSVKYKKKVFVMSFLLFIFLGIFSATFYSSTVHTSTCIDYVDLPRLLNILLKNKAGEEVYSPSSYTYYVMRIVKMAHLKFSLDPSCRLYIIDKNYVESEVMEKLLKDENFMVLYYGYRFILLKRC